MPAQPVVIDACSALNLLATERAVDLLQALEWTLLVLPEVKQEARFFRGPVDEEGRPTQLTVDWSPLEKQERMVLQSSELLGDAFVDALVNAAAHLTDVDAATVALAGTLGRPLLSDDGKVRKVFRSLHPALELHSTLGVIRRASGPLGLDAPALRDLLRGLHAKARFAPPKSDPDREWYLAHLRD